MVRISDNDPGWLVIRWSTIPQKQSISITCRKNLVTNIFLWNTCHDRENYLRQKKGMDRTFLQQVLNSSQSLSHIRQGHQVNQDWQQTKLQLTTKTERLKDLNEKNYSIQKDLTYIISIREPSHCNKYRKVGCE